MVRHTTKNRQFISRRQRTHLTLEVTPKVSNGEKAVADPTKITANKNFMIGCFLIEQLLQPQQQFSVLSLTISPEEDTSFSPSIPRRPLSGKRVRAYLRVS